MTYSIDSLYDVMTVELEKAIDFSVDRRYFLVNALAFEVCPYTGSEDLAKDFLDFILDVASALKNLGVERDDSEDHLLLSQEMALVFIYDHIRERDVNYICKVHEIRRENGY